MKSKRVYLRLSVLTSLRTPLFNLLDQKLYGYAKKYRKKSVPLCKGQKVGSGVASGQDRARIAAEAAVSSPLLEDINLSGANGVLVNVTAGY